MANIKLKRVAAGAAVAVALSLALGTTVSAAPGSSGPGSSVGSSGSLGAYDSGSLGIGADAPKMVTTQGDGKVSVEMHNPKGFLGVCTPVLLQADQALKLLDDPTSILDGGPGITLFTPPVPLITNKWNSIGKVNNGVYVLAGVCAGLPPKDTAIQFLIVPEGLGSVNSAIDFGSTAGSLAAGSLGGIVGGILGS